MWDSHLHTHFSGDSEEDIKNILAEAKRKGLRGITVTDHQDFDYPRVEDLEFLIPFEDYFEDLAKENKYSPELRIGIELGMQPHVADLNYEVSRGYPFDFIIGSIHTIEGTDPYYGTYFEGKTKKEAYEGYFKYTLENIRLFTDFDVLGHIDYMIRYYPGQDKAYSYSDYSDYIDAIFTELIKSGRGIEINTSGIRKGIGLTHPQEDTLRRYRELGGDIITIGSDAHIAGDVGADFKTAVEVAKKCGFDYYAVYKARSPEFFKL